MKPVPIASIATALKLHLQQVHCALNITAAWHVCVPIVPHGVAQTLKQRLLQVIAHAIAHDGPHQDAKREEKRTNDVRQHQQLPSQEFGGVHAVVADLAPQKVNRAGGQADGDQHVWHRVDLL